MTTLRRSRRDRVIGGVCGGLAEYLALDPLLVRILFILFGVMTGMGVVAYILLWVIVPAEDATFATRDEMIRQNVEEIRERAQHLGREAQSSLDRTWEPRHNPAHRVLFVGAGLIAIGLLVLLKNLGILGWLNRLWPLALIAIGLVILINNLKDKRR